MLNVNQWTSELYKGLLPLIKSPLKKQCPKCGQVYKNLEEFISQTQDETYSSGLIEAVKGGSRVIIGLYRQCSCGENLLALCKDRRDTSNEGRRKRIAFGQLLDSFNAAGVKLDVARQELLKVLDGEESDLLKKYEAALAVGGDASKLERLRMDR